MPKSAEPSTEHWHGTYNGYSNRKCRGPKCREANAAFVRKTKQKRFQQTLDPAHPLHGTTNFYGNYGCRCERCATAWTASLARPAKERKALIEDLRALSPLTEIEAHAIATTASRKAAVEEALQKGQLPSVSRGARYEPWHLAVPPASFGKLEVTQWFPARGEIAIDHIRAAQKQHHLSYRVANILAEHGSNMGALARQVNRRHDWLIKVMRGHRILKDKDARTLYEALGKDYQEFLADFSAHYPD